MVGFPTSQPCLNLARCALAVAAALDDDVFRSLRRYCILYFVRFAILYDKCAILSLTGKKVEIYLNFMLV